MIIIDTSIFIEYIRRDKYLREIISGAVRAGEKMVVPMIVLGELLAGESMSGVREQKNLLKLLKEMELMEISCGVAYKYGEIRRKNWSKGNDAWIAACCLERGARLATLNTKDFIKVKGLKLWPVKSQNKSYKT